MRCKKRFAAKFGGAKNMNDLSKMGLKNIMWEKRDMSGCVGTNEGKQRSETFKRNWLKQFGECHSLESIVIAGHKAVIQ